MTILCGILGKSDSTAVRRMAAAMGLRGSHLNLAEGKDYSIASDASVDESICLVDGAPRGSSGDPLTPEALLAYCKKAGDAKELELDGPVAAVVRMKDTGRWWLIRDRLGRKPLFYTEQEGCVLFASQLKGILASDLTPKHLNLTALDRYLTLRCVPGPETIVQGVYRVSPGHVVEYSNSEVSENLFASYDVDTRPSSREASSEMLSERLRQSMARTQSTTVLYSGGLDSAALAGLKPATDMLFIQLERAWQHEVRFARESARLMKRPLETGVAHKFSEDTFVRVIRALDEPLSDPSALPLWHLFEETSRHAKTVISGHGADELLGGFPRFHFLQKTRGAHALVPVTLLAEIAPVLPPNAFIRRGSRYLSSIRDNIEAYLSLISVFDRGERDAMYTDVMKAALSDTSGPEVVLRSHFIHGDLTRNLLSFDLGVGLPDLSIAKWDRLAAANGVSLELPYVDDDVVEFAASLEAKTKFGVRSKPLLRLATKDVVPARIRLRARRDFHIPMEGRLVQVIDSLTRQIITRDRVEGIGVFKWQSIDQALRSSTHNVYRRRQFWALLMFFAWYREFMES